MRGALFVDSADETGTSAGDGCSRRGAAVSLLSNLSGICGRQTGLL
jgi:hypothetical protein